MTLSEAVSSPLYRFSSSARSRASRGDERVMAPWKTRYFFSQFLAEDARNGKQVGMS